LFLALTLVIEVLLVYSFQMVGLIDRNVLTANFLVPLANWTFTVSISPLFHLLPLGVIIVLLSSWTYLTKHTAFAPQRVEPPRRVSTVTRRGQESRRFKSFRLYSKRLNRRLQRIGRAFKAGALRIPGVSYISQRLSFARAKVRSAVTVSLIFLSLAFLLFLIEYPDSIHQWTLNLYRSAPAFQNFVFGTTQWVQGVGQAVAPLGGLGAAVNNALVDAGPGFRRSLEGAGASLSAPIFALNVVDKYVLSQNLGAWISALVALAYGAYASSRSLRRPKGR